MLFRSAQREVHLHPVGVVPATSSTRPWLWWGQHHVRGPREARLWDVRQDLIQRLWNAVHDIRVVTQAPAHNLHEAGIQAGVQAVLAQVDVLSIREVAVELAVEHVLDYRPHAEYIHLGKHGLDACLNAGLVEIVRGGLGDHTNVVYRVPEALYEVLAYIPQTGLSGAAHMMLAPPEPWTGAAGGGYYSDRMQVDFPCAE